MSGFFNFSDFDVVAVDTETNGLDWTVNRMFGFSVTTAAGSGYWDIREQPEALVWLRKQAEQYSGILVNQNLKFDLHMMLNEGVDFKQAKKQCTMIRACLIDEHLFEYNLDSLARKYLGKTKENDIYPVLASMFGGQPTRNSAMKHLHRAPASVVRPYAIVDTELAYELWHWQEQEIKKQDLSQVWNLEYRLFPHIFDMERRGIKVDIDEAKMRQEMITPEIDRIRRQLDAMAGFPVNPNPSASIHKLFEPKRNEQGYWVANDGTILEETGAGKPSIGSEALERMKHPAAKMIQRVRKLIKARDTFIGGHILGHERNGYVHPNINQTKGDETGGTGTGRLSYTQPALQQIPARDREIASIVRPIFRPDEGQGWAYCDLDQFELRIFHHFVNNPGIIKAYRDNPDLDGHQIVADLTGLPRNAGKSGGVSAKQLNLGAVFNMGGGSMAEKMGLPFTMEEIQIGNKTIIYRKPGPEAQDIIDTYFRMVPGVKEIAKKAKSIATSRGYVKSIMGRHLRFPGKQFTHKASGLVYQSSSADLNKSNIINTCEYLKSECPEGRLLLSIHDELSFSLPWEGSMRHLHEMKRIIQHHPNIRVPIRTDFSALSNTWWEANNADLVTKDS